MLIEEDAVVKVRVMYWWHKWVVLARLLGHFLPFLFGTIEWHILPRQPIPARARASGLACHRLLLKGADSNPVFAGRVRLCLRIDR